MQRKWEGCYRIRNHRTCEALPVGLVDELKESCTGTRWTETCVAPRHVDASRDALLAICSFCSLCCTRPVFYLYFISSVRIAWGGARAGGGGRCQTFSFCYFPLSSRPRAVSATYRVKYVVFFSGWQPIFHTRNMRNNNNNNNYLFCIGVQLPGS